MFQASWPFVMAACFLTGCGEPEEPAKTDAVRPVKILRVQPVSDLAPLSFPAMIHARQSSELAFNVAGKIAEMTVLEGAVVEEGDVIATLDAADFQSRREAAKAAFELAQTEFQRIENLVARGAVAAAELDRRRAEMQAARTELDLAESALGDTVLRAPFRGVVGKRIIGQFGNIQAKQAVVQFQALKPLDVVIDIPERLMITGRRGPDAVVDAVVRFSTFDGLELPVRLHEISTKADPVTQTFRAVWTLEDPGDAMVLPGMSATLVARQLTRAEGEKEIFLLPPLAVTGGDTADAHVWVLDESSGKVGKRTVKVGRLRDGGLEILDGLATGDPVVVAGVSQMVDGLKVRPMSNP
jgi:RND family efflux transporter MFP subunit